MGNKNITQKDLKHLRNLRSTLSKISRARGTPKRLKIFIEGLIKQLDKIMRDGKIRNRLDFINSVMELIIKISSVIQLFK